MKRWGYETMRLLYYETSFGALGAPLGFSWSLFDSSWGLFGGAWKGLGSSSGALGDVLCPGDLYFRETMKPLLVLLERLWNPLGASLPALGVSWGALARALGARRELLGTSSAQETLYF